MTVFKKLLTTCIFLTGISSVFAQSPISPVSTLFGHAAVTVLTPAALSNPQSLLFKDVDVTTDDSTENNSTLQNGPNTTMTAGSIRVLGSHTVYSVTLSAKQLKIHKNGKQITISDFTAESQSSENEGRHIRLGGVLKLTPAGSTRQEQNDAKLALMVNYN